MTIATVLFVSLLCCGVYGAAQDGPAPVLACNLKAIAPGDRPRYNDLTKRLRASVRERKEQPDGFVFKLNGGAIGLRDAAEWISMERLCCPFLTFQLSTSGNQTDWMLTLTGPQGAKAVLQEEFPTR